MNINTSPYNFKEKALCMENRKCLIRNRGNTIMWGFPGGSAVMQTTQETWVWSLGREDPPEEALQPSPVFLSEKLHGQRSLAGCSRGVTKSRTGLKRLSMSTTLYYWLKCKQQINYANNV